MPEPGGFQVGLFGPRRAIQVVEKQDVPLTEAMTAFVCQTWPDMLRMKNRIWTVLSTLGVRPPRLTVESLPPPFARPEGSCRGPIGSFDPMSGLRHVALVML